MAVRLTQSAVRTPGRVPATLHARKAWPWVHLFLMLAAAAYFRLPGLGELSLYGDEDHTALGVLGILASGFPATPSGLAYWRAAPFSYLAAASALLFGLSEFSLRLPSAIFGILTVPIFYALARRLIGALPAAFAAWLLVFSAWHIDMSRESRAYALFLMFLLLALIFFLKGYFEASRASRVILIPTTCIALMLHELGILIIALFCISVLFGKLTIKPKERICFLLSASALSIFWLVHQRLTAFVVPVMPGTTKVYSPLGFLDLLPLGFTPKFWLLSHILNYDIWLFLIIVLISTSFICYNWIAFKNNFASIFSGILLTLAAINLYGLIFVIIVILLLLIQFGKVKIPINQRQTQWIILQVSVIFIFWLLYGLLVWRGDGVAVYSYMGLLKKILKDSFYYPALHILLYFEAFPIMTAIVSFGTLYWLIFFFHSRIVYHYEPIIFLWFWIPLFVLGFKREWVYLRYTIISYPFYLMIFTWTVYYGFTYVQGKVLAFTRKNIFISQRSRISQFLALFLLMLIIPFADEQHNLQDAYKIKNLYYNQSVDPLWHGFPFHPDHKTAGEYVKINLMPDDIVVAMDVFEQYYYVGKTNYWLTTEFNKSMFGYQKRGIWYDIYTATPIITRRDELEEVIARSAGSRVWLITSGELDQQLSRLFPPDLLDFLSAASAKLVLVGRDHATRVYRFETAG